MAMWSWLRPVFEVAQSAVIEAPNGAVILAAGQNVDVTGRGLEGILPERAGAAGSGAESGTLRGDAVGILQEHSSTVVRSTPPRLAWMVGASCQG